MSRIFEARYPGRCANDCGVRIEPGDPVVYVDDDPVHAQCEEATATERVLSVCGKCHLTKPCECDDEEAS